MTRPTRPIDSVAYLKKVCVYKQTGCGSCPLQTTCPADEPTVDAIPVSFIQELIERDKQLIDEYGGKPDFEVIVDGLIERAVNYEALIEKWREKNGTKTD